MTVVQASGLPLEDSSTVNVQMTIFPNNGEYTAYICADMGMFHRFPIQLKPHDIKNLNIQLQRAVEKVALYFGQENAYDDALSNLALVGSFAFKSMFPEGPSRKKIRSALKTGSVIQISSTDFFLPWELLYDNSSVEAVDIASFWGTNHIISRAIVQDARPGDFVSSVIKTTRPKVGLLAYDKLEHVSKQEIPALRKLHQNKRISLSRLPILDGSQKQRKQGLFDFGHFLCRNHHILHLACHAFEMDPVDQSFLNISDDFHISICDFVVSEFEMKHNPFVILNACLTSTINPLYTFYWAAEFWKRGARGVLATDFHVPDWFAAAFSEELYQHLLSGETIGKSLTMARRHFWETQRNPLGLAYALYASPSIRIES